MLLLARRLTRSVPGSLERLLRPPGRRLPLRPRRYLPASLGVREFCEALEARGLRYVVLRWFDRLPDVAPGEDIDLLVADDALGGVSEFLVGDGGPVKCDLYTASGLPGTQYRDMAYYPPHLAERILARSVLHEGWCRVPCLEDHFLSLTYHALYHKGPRAGLRTTTPGVVPTTTPEHDYAGALADLAARLRVDIGVTMEHLDDLLAERGWRPPFDTLDRLSIDNPWIEARLAASLTPVPVQERGLTVFVLRQAAFESLAEPVLLRWLSRRGFDILETKRLTSAEALECSRHIRGGNWGRGPYPMSGGGPALVVATCDLSPWPVHDELRRRYPRLENGRIAEVKKDLRAYVNRQRPADRQCNVLHSSDHDAQAWEYVRIAMPEHEAALQQRIRQLHEGFRTTVPVRRNLTRFGRRAKVELVEHQGRAAVRKTFRPGHHQSCQRERTFMQRFSQQRPEIPPVLESGENYLVVPYYENVLRPPDQRRRLLPAPLMPLPVAKQAIEVLRFIYTEGYALLDCTPANVIVDRVEGVKLIDFEFAHRYEDKPPRFEDCYSIIGVPPDFDGEAPLGVRRAFPPYETKWRPRVGLALGSLLYDPTWKQHVKRCWYQCAQFVQINEGRVRRRLRRMGSRIRSAGLWPAGIPIKTWNVSGRP